jgi:hypothetical protein
MTIHLTRAQLIAFLALVAAIVTVTLAPIIVTGIRGQSVPDSLIAVTDKTVIGLIGVLGTLVGVMWQSRPKGNEPAGTPNDPVSVEEVTP